MKVTFGLGAIFVVLGMIAALLALLDVHLFGLSDPHLLALAILLVAIGVLIG